MKIAILGSVALPIPPEFQGGTERVAYDQATGLASKGHDITLIAAHGSRPSEDYTLVEIGGGDTVTGSSRHADVGLTETSRGSRKEAVYLAQVASWLQENAGDYDLVLNNMRYGESLFLPIMKQRDKTMVNVMHLPLFDELADIFRAFDTPVITISNAQRKGFDGVRYIGTTYNPVNIDEYPYALESRGDYVLMMGSIAPHKNQHDAILAARQSGMKIIFAGKIGDESYYKKSVEQYVDDDQVVHLGEIDHAQKVELYQNARALLFPTSWPEPFGLVMIEAMSCGTPVIAYDNGAVPEVVVDGKTGFVVRQTDDSSSEESLRVSESGVSGLVKAIEQIGDISRDACRTHVESTFTKAHMVDSLESLLKSLIENL